ncbi:MAG: hypothetical protein Q9M26_05805 [Mariprofundales bacterium]|nr:hypothetical protein [Mariprofundales bacterium]
MERLILALRGCMVGSLGMIRKTAILSGINAVGSAVGGIGAGIKGLFGK